MQIVSHTDEGRATIHQKRLLGEKILIFNVVTTFLSVWKNGTCFFWGCQSDCVQQQTVDKCQLCCSKELTLFAQWRPSCSVVGTTRATFCVSFFFLKSGTIAYCRFIVFLHIICIIVRNYTKKVRFSILFPDLTKKKKKKPNKSKALNNKKKQNAWYNGDVQCEK